MLPFYPIDLVTRYLAEAALNSLWLGPALALLTWVVLRLFGRANATTRHVIWGTALVAIVALPFLSGDVPAAAKTGSPPAWVALGPDWAGRVCGIWALIAAIMLGRLLWSYAYIRWLARTCTPLPQALARLARRWTGPGGRVRVSRQISVPAVIGLRRPAIVIPEALLRKLSADEFEQVVLHEWSHIRRQDHWANLAQEFLHAVFFFQPAVWWIGREMRREREMACDDAVVAATDRPLPYAGCLAKLVEWNSRGAAPLSTGAVSSGSEAIRRVERLVRGERSGLGLSRLAWWSASAALLLGAGLSRQVPTVVAVAGHPRDVREAMAPAERMATQLRQEQDRNRLAAERLRAADETLRAANARLSEAERVLRAARRQRHAADEQMRAANARMSLADILTAGRFFLRPFRVSCPAPAPPVAEKLHKI